MKIEFIECCGKPPVLMIWGNHHGILEIHCHNPSCRVLCIQTYDSRIEFNLKQLAKWWKRLVKENLKAQTIFGKDETLTRTKWVLPRWEASDGHKFDSFEEEQKKGWLEFNKDKQEEQALEIAYLQQRIIELEK